MSNLWLAPHSHPLVLGHRGACAHAPENTLASFRLAREQRADGIEFDTKRCASGEVVIMHDISVDRTTNGHGDVHTLTLAELRALDAGGGQPVPTLDEVFEEVGRDVLMNIEVTNYSTRNDGLEEAIVEVIQRHAIDKRVMFSSFNPFSLRKLAGLAPQIPGGILYHPRMPVWLRHVWLAPFIPHAFLHPEKSMVTKAETAALRKRGIGVNTWTVNDPADILRVTEAGVNAIMGDSPATIRTTLGI
jgi:glycerophosphoryl diester phosphodiesterase